MFSENRFLVSCLLTIMAVKKSRKRSGFVAHSYFKDSEFTAVKRDAKFYTKYVKGVPFVCQKWYMKG